MSNLARQNVVGGRRFVSSDFPVEVPLVLPCCGVVSFKEKSKRIKPYLSIHPTRGENNVKTFSRWELRLGRLFLGRLLWIRKKVFDFFFSDKKISGEGAF